ncbi:hypothetical protein SAMN05444387_1425 [Flavobacterium pectinovorum]|uniref:Uncharacterized protein n=2 Tax=Flavobacterium pectinovorum TaxID=29533 RepID=A0ABY1J0Y4_9FLAO|nr:hypothetical protein SAMN05444387_1425 [Flavobacterium pectinovorum]
MFKITTIDLSLYIVLKLYREKIPKQPIKIGMIFVSQKFMKKLLLLSLLISKSVLFGQTVLASFPLDLKKTTEENQVLNVENTQTHDVFVFAATTENVTILKYNSALFLNEQFTFPKTNLENRSLVGYSFGEDGNPNLYWALEDFKNIIIVKYYLETKTQKMLQFSFPFSTHDILNFFQENNAFYILSKERNVQALTLYTFKNGTAEEKVFDFSTYKFQNKNTQFVTFNRIVDEDPIEKIDVKEFVPLDKSSKKSKAYLFGDHLILTFDYNPKKTQVFDLDIEKHTISEKSFIQPGIDNANKSNSFLNDNKLYQISLNKYGFAIDVKDFNSGSTLKEIKVLKNDTIKFKNSPLFVQTDGRKPSELRKTSQFLSQLYFLNVGLSAFKNQRNTLLTIGGSPKEEDYSSFYYNGDFPQIDHARTVYFESILNNNLEFIQEPQLPLAIDNIYYFLSTQKRIAFQNIFKFKDYSILGYYDNATKQYVMRKFTDGFMEPEITNPIINKAIFSRDFPLEKP